jgi:hypothetical protein
VAPEPVIDPLDVKRSALAEAMVAKLGDHYQVEWPLLRNMPEPVIDRLLDHYGYTGPLYVA